MENVFSIGTKVRHKSGTGPKMAVKSIAGETNDDNGSAEVQCEWFDEKKQIWVCEFFDARLLVKVEESMGGIIFG